MRFYPWYGLFFREEGGIQSANLPGDIPCIFTAAQKKPCDLKSPFREMSGRCSAGKTFTLK